MADSASIPTGGAQGGAHGGDPHFATGITGCSPHQGNMPGDSQGEEAVIHMAEEEIDHLC